MISSSSTRKKQQQHTSNFKKQWDTKAKAAADVEASSKSSSPTIPRGDQMTNERELEEIVDETSKKPHPATIMVAPRSMQRESHSHLKCFGVVDVLG